MRAGFKRQANGQHLVYLRAKLPRVLRHLRKIFPPAKRCRLNTNSVHGNFHFMRIFHAAHQIERIAPHANANAVFAIHRKVMLHQEATLGAQRQALNVLILRQVR